MIVWVVIWDGRDSELGKEEVLGVMLSMDEAKAWSARHSELIASDNVQHYSLQEWAIGEDLLRNSVAVRYRNGQDPSMR